MDNYYRELQRGGGQDLSHYSEQPLLLLLLPPPLSRPTIHWLRAFVKSGKNRVWGRSERKAMDDESHAGESSRHVAKQDAKSQEHNADSLKGEALPAELGTWTSTSAEAEKSDVFPLVEASSISMSAGADPWADPSPVAAMASAISGSKRPARDNPWASNTFDLGVGGSAFPSAETVASGLREESQTQAHLEDRWGELHLPRLGNTLARYWSIKPGLLQLNSGEAKSVSAETQVCDADNMPCCFRIVWYVSQAGMRRLQGSAGSSRGEYRCESFHPISFYLALRSFHFTSAVLSSGAPR